MESLLSLGVAQILWLQRGLSPELDSFFAIITCLGNGAFISCFSRSSTGASTGAMAPGSPY